MTPTARSLLAALALPVTAVSFAFVPLACAPLASPAATAGEASRADLWDWCPAAVPASEIDEERLWVQFGEGALYCTVPRPTWDGSVTAWSQLEDKAQLRLVPGDNFLPLEAGEHDVTLPVCSKKASDGAPVDVESGRLFVQRTDQLGRTRVDLSYLQTARDEEGEPLTSYLRVSGYEDDLSAGVLLDGAPWPLPDPDVHLALCDGERCGEGERVAALDTCRFDGPREVHVLRFDGGEIRFVLETKGDGGPLRAHLVVAEGVIDSVAFQQQSFWRLVGRESWPWSSARDIAVLFDTPAGGYCGLTAKEAYHNQTSGSVELRSCDGGSSTRMVLSHTMELENVEEEEPTETP